MHRIVRIIQGWRIVEKPFWGASGLLRRSASQSGVVDGPDPASDRLPVRVDPDKEGRVLEAEQVAPAEAAEVQVQQVQHRERF